MSAATLDRAEIRRRIAALELMADAQSAISDVEGVEFDPFDDATFKLEITTGGQAVAFVVGVPPEAMVRALRALQESAA